MDYESIVTDLENIVLRKHHRILMGTQTMELYETDFLHRDVRVSLTELAGADSLAEPQQVVLNNYQLDINHLYFQHTSKQSEIGRKREKEIFGAVKTYIVGTVLTTIGLNATLGGCSAACISFVGIAFSIPAFNYYFNYKCKDSDLERSKLDKLWESEFSSLRLKVLEDLVKYESAQTIK